MLGESETTNAMGFSRNKKAPYYPKIKKYTGLLRENKIYDNYYNIINSFEHEKSHYGDFKLDLTKYSSPSKKEKEGHAISNQMSHESYENTSSVYQFIIYK